MGKSKKFGLFSIVLLGINSIIGSGIFLMPGKAYVLMGTKSLLVYLFITLLAGSMALCFAEAAGYFKSNGAAYVYVKEAFGNLPGFEVGVMKYIVQIIAWATMAVGFVTALSAIWPAAGSGMTKNIIISAILIILGIVNYIGVDFTKYLNNIATVGKLIPLILFIAVGIFFLKGANYSAGLNTGITVGKFSETAILVFYAFTGFEAIATASEDMENPKKNIPRAIIIAFAVVSVTYFLIQLVSIGILGNVLGTTETPVVEAMKHTFLGSAGSAIVTAGTLISIGGINIAQSFYAPRGLSALGETHMLPKVVAKQSKRETPGIAILITTILTLPIALSGSFTTLAAISVISRFTQYIPTCLSILVFRKRNMESNFKVPFGPIIPIVATVVSLWLLYNADRMKLLIGIGVMVIGIPIYYLMVYYNRKHGYEFSKVD
ncbi:S-methylmethionine permease [Lachnospiraceae bacterium KM106-2]|nr:S-methylmethionine permease [Lachnospiraceae bacterium KM106-2]